MVRKNDKLSREASKEYIILLIDISIDWESYEELMQEQFDTMKKSFIKKIEIQNDEVNNLKLDSRRKVNNLQDELNQVTHTKHLFLKQITELQKQLGI